MTNQEVLALARRRRALANGELKHLLEHLSIFEYIRSSQEWQEIVDCLERLMGEEVKE